MPSYDYKCQKCGHSFEGAAGMSDPCPPCPAPLDPPLPGLNALCDGQVVKQFTSSPPAHFHGHGWAKDGYSKGRR